MSTSDNKQGEVVEELNIKRVVGADPEPQAKYRVTEKAARESTEDSIGSEGIFKNGTIYKPGDIIELGDKTAARFKELGEVEDV